MKIEEVLKKGKEKLIENKIEDANIISRVLLQYVLKLDRNQLIINQFNEIKEEQITQYIEFIDKIIEGMPLQYITKKQEFYGLDFYVDENVLIPQPDTEILVEEVLKIAKNGDKILDICTGSGCIGISIASNIENVEVIMTDISENALKVAEKNAKNNQVLEKVQLIQSDMFEKVDSKFDIIVSNPPYIETKVIKNLDKQVQKEPMIALDGGKDGLIFYRKIISEAPKYLKEKGCLCLEIGYDQKEKVVELIKNIGIFKDIKEIKDLSGNDRVIIVRK